jgi:hypothetical protein
MHPNDLLVGGGWGAKFFWILLFLMYSHQNSHFVPQTKFPVGSQHVLQALEVFPNMVTIAPHFVPYGFCPTICLLGYSRLTTETHLFICLE